MLDCGMGLPRGPVIDCLRSKSFHKHRCGRLNPRGQDYVLAHIALRALLWLMEAPRGRSLRKQLSSSSAAFDFYTFKVNCVHYIRFEGLKSCKIDCTTVFLTVIVDPLFGKCALEHAGQHVMSQRALIPLLS